MRSVNLYLIWITKKLAVELLDSGIASSIFEQSIRNPPTGAIYKYGWYIDRHEIHLFLSSEVSAKQSQDDLARQLMIIPTQQAREIYIDELRRDS